MEGCPNRLVVFAGRSPSGPPLRSRDLFRKITSNPGSEPDCGRFALRLRGTPSPRGSRMTAVLLRERAWSKSHVRLIQGAPRSHLMRDAFDVDEVERGDIVRYDRAAPGAG